MKNDISKISVSVTASQSAYLSALRDAAFYLLEKAAALDEENVYNTRAQVVKIFEEHRAFSKKGLV